MFIYTFISYCPIINTVFTKTLCFITIKRQTLGAKCLMLFSILTDLNNVSLMYN